MAQLRGDVAALYLTQSRPAESAHALRDFDSALALKTERQALPTAVGKSPCLPSSGRSSDARDTRQRGLQAGLDYQHAPELERAIQTSMNECPAGHAVHASTRPPSCASLLFVAITACRRWDRGDPGSAAVVPVVVAIPEGRPSANQYRQQHGPPRLFFFFFCFFFRFFFFFFFCYSSVTCKFV